MDKIQQMLIQMLQRSSFFKNIPEEKLIKFANLFKLWMAVKWQAIIKEWEKPEKIYIAKNWKFIAKKADGLKSITLWEIKEWEVFGEMSYFYNKPAVASVICESNTCAYWEISRKDFENFLKENPSVAQIIAEELKRREKENKERLWGKYQNNDTEEIEINL